ncbi:MAG: rhodanese-like domain-containing protein [Rhodospirillales bacterium]|nr:rhodanese-like domain-containing protein [Rhodospirillales bacterium]
MNNLQSSGSRANPAAVDAPATGAYAGDLSPQEAWNLLRREPAAILVDCRSPAEWTFVGLPDLSSLGKRVVCVPWQSWSGTVGAPMAPNPQFAADLGRAQVGPDEPVIFLCRSGGRSKAAAVAMTAQGYRHCYNLAGGFEGPHDPAKHRGGVAGWKAAGLPWAQE